MGHQPSTSPSLISTSGPARDRSWLIAAGLVLLTIAVYWRVGTFDFINYDDPDYVTKNPWVHAGLTPAALHWAFTTGHASNWHPLTWISHMVDGALFGSRPGPAHLVNLLFHMANTVLLFVLLKRATGEMWRSAWVAALFALHPLHIQSVAWISERKDVLSTFFGFLAIGAYIVYAQTGRRNRYALMLLFAACSLMSKPMLVTLPGLLLLLDYWPLRRVWNKTLILEKIPLLALSVASSAVTLIVQRKFAAMSLEQLPLPARLANAVVACFVYLYKMLWPAHLSIFYPYAGRWPGWLLALSMAVLLAISIFAIAARRERPYLLAGWAWYLVSLVPVIGIVQVGPQAFADRYTYLPLIGLFLMIAWGAADLCRKLNLPKELLPALGALTIGVCMCLCAWQLPFWRDSLTIFTRSLEVAPRGNFTAEVNLGAALVAAGRVDEAIAHYENALKIHPAGRNYTADFDYGRALVKRGDFAGAIVRFQQALEAIPGDPDSTLELANALDAAGRWEEAESRFKEGLRLAPENARMRFGYGAALFDRGKLDQAEEQLSACLQIDPRNVQAHEELALLRARQGRIGEAITEATEATQADPKNLTARLVLGELLANNGQAREAIPQYGAALQLNPNSVEALNNLAEIFAANADGTLRNGVEAVALIERALSLTQGSDATCWATACAAYAEAGRLPQAADAATRAIQLAEATGNTQFANSIRARIDAYQRKIQSQSSGPPR